MVSTPVPNPATYKLTNPREQDKEATVYIGNIDERVTDSLVWELMLQAGRIVNVHLPKDRVTQNHQGYGFVEFISEEDAEYAARIMNQVRLYGKPIRVNKVRFMILCAIDIDIPHAHNNMSANSPRPPQTSRRPSRSALSSSSATSTPSSTRRPSTILSRASARWSRRPRSHATKPASPRATVSCHMPPSTLPTMLSPT